MKAGPKWRPAGAKPLVPAATEAELNEAAKVWTDAQDVMAARGYGRLLFGNQSRESNEFIVLMLRAHRRLLAGERPPEDLA
jgi:hypothetical protein